MREYDSVIATMKREKETEEDAIYNELLYIKNRIGASSKIMTDTEKTAFYFVLTPEDMVIDDTIKAAGLFARFNVPLTGYVVNRVISEDLRDQQIPQYLKNRIDMQQTCLKTIREKFGDKVLATVPEFDNEIKGLKTIEGMATAMFGGEKI